MKTLANQQQSNFSCYSTVLWMTALGLFLVGTMVSAPLAFTQNKVTNGTLTINGISGASFVLSGTNATTTNNFNMTGGIDGGGGPWPVLCDPCFGPVNVNLSAVGLDFDRFGNGNEGATTYSQIAWSDINLQGGPTLISINGPLITLTGPGSYAGTFTYTLALCGLTTFVGLPHCDVTLPSQTGTGTVMLTVGIDSIGQNYVTSAIYSIP